MCLLAICIFFLEKCLFRVFCPVFNLIVFLMLSCVSSLYILDINLLSFAHIFSHSVGCLIVQSMVSLAVQKLLSFTRYHFDRMLSTGEGNGKSLQYPCLENPINSMKMQNYRMLKDELPRQVGAQYATGDQWRSNSRKNEGMEPKQKQHPVVDDW